MSSKIIHKHSSVITDGKPKIPTENQLEYGELAINYGKGVETISFKNTNNEIVEIKTKNYFDEKILLNSKDINSLEDKVNDIKSTIEENELVTATALSDLDDKINSIGNELTDKSDKEHIHVSSAITDSISSMTDITETASGLVQGKAVYELINDTEEQITETLLEHDTRINNILVEIENNELVTAAALSDLDVRTNDIKLNVENNELITAAAITEINGRINTIQGNDKNTSMRNIASQEIAKVVAEAPDNLNTLKEIADWIANDTTGSIQMSNDIVELKQIVSGYTSENKIKTDIDSKSPKTHTHDYLPLSGGTMSGDIDMGGNEFKNTNFELVESLPTENLYEGRQVTYEGKIYTYHNEKWLNIVDDLGGKPETHEENFVYQPTAADLSIKDGFADIKKLKGNTVVWNQMFDYSNIINDNKATYDNLTGIFTCTPTNQGFILRTKNLAKINHYHLISCEIKSDNNAKVNVWNGTLQPVVVSATSNWQKVASIIKCTDVTRSLGVASQDSVNSFEVKNLKAFDLTQMFGEGNEPTIEEFEAMFPNSYYEYNEGELLSFDGKGLKSVGFNQWDEEWVLGAYNISDGSVISGSGGATHIRNTNPIKVLPDTNYYFKSPVTLFVFWYDSNMNFISSNRAKDTTSTSPANAAYLNFYQYSKNTYGNDICINLSHSGYLNGEYKPYEDNTLLFQEGKTISQLTGKLNGEGESVTIFPDGLRSAGEAYDEITYNKSTGKYKAVKRIGAVDMGTLSWRGEHANITGWWAEFTKMAERTANQVPNIITKKYITRQNYNVAAGKDKTIGTALGTDTYNRHIVILDLDYTNPEDRTAFVQSLAGQILYYELAKPEVYELDFPINTSYEAYDFGTEEVLYNDDNEVNIPMKANIEYGFNAVDMIRGNYFEVDKIKKGLNEINFLITDLDVRTNDIKSTIENNELVTATALSDLDIRTNDIKSTIENNELVTASAITNLEERIKELEKKINQLLSNN